MFCPAATGGVLPIIATGFASKLRHSVPADKLLDGAAGRGIGMQLKPLLRGVERAIKESVSEQQSAPCGGKWVRSGRVRLGP
jgi:hypothetical protein